MATSRIPPIAHQAGSATPASTEAAAAIGLRESLALLAAASASYTKAVAKLGANKEPRLAAIAAEIAAEIAAINTANTALQAVAAPAA